LPPPRPGHCTSARSSRPSPVICRRRSTTGSGCCASRTSTRRARFPGRRTPSSRRSTRMDSSGTAPPCTNRTIHRAFSSASIDSWPANWPTPVRVHGSKSARLRDAGQPAPFTRARAAIDASRRMAPIQAPFDSAREVQRPASTTSPRVTFAVTLRGTLATSSFDARTV